MFLCYFCCFLPPRGNFVYTILGAKAIVRTEVFLTVWVPPAKENENLFVGGNCIFIILEVPFWFQANICVKITLAVVSDQYPIWWTATICFFAFSLKHMLMRSLDVHFFLAPSIINGIIFGACERQLVNILPCKIIHTPFCPITTLSYCIKLWVNVNN